MLIEAATDHLEDAVGLLLKQLARAFPGKAVVITAMIVDLHQGMHVAQSHRPHSGRWPLQTPQSTSDETRDVLLVHAACNCRLHLLAEPARITQRLSFSQAERYLWNGNQPTVLCTDLTEQNGNESQRAQ